MTMHVVLCPTVHRQMLLNTGGAQLYEAAVLMKDILRGRAALLIQDRTDIVAAAEADGVVLDQDILGDRVCGQLVGLELQLAVGRLILRARLSFGGPDGSASNRSSRP